MNGPARRRLTSSRGSIRKGASRDRDRGGRVACDFSTLLGGAMFLAILLLVTAATLLAPSTGAAWEMDRLDVNIVIGSDARLRVVETLNVRFGAERSRGIYRTLPLSVVDRTGSRHRFDILLMAVTDGEGRPRPTRVRQRGEYVEIWLGQSQTFATGDQVYILAYDVEGAILRGQSWDELKWNVTGRPWDVPIIEAAVTVEFPPGATTDEVDGSSYVSKFGQLGRQTDWKLMDGSRAQFALRRGLVPFEEFTVALAWPAGLVTHPGPFARAAELARRQPIWFLPVLALLGAAWVGRRRRSQAHPEPSVLGPPTGLTPAEVGMVADELHAPEAADIVATIFDLAARKRLRVEYREASGREVVLHRESAPGRALKAHEEAILDALFDGVEESRREEGGRDAVHVDEIGARLRPHLPRIDHLIESELVRAGNLDREPTDPRSGGARWAIGVLFGGLLAGYAWARVEGQIFPHAWLAIAASSVLAALVVLMGCRIMPRRTRAGARVLAWARSFEARSQEIEPSQLDESTRQTSFESLFPYSVALGVSEQWTRAFRGQIGSPEWWLASGPDGSPSDRIDRELVASARVLAAAIQRAPRSARGALRPWLRDGDGSKVRPPIRS